MKVRFLALTESNAKGFPFVPGQVIDVPEMTNEVRRWLKYRHAEILREEPERAVVVPQEQAVAQPVVATPTVVEPPAVVVPPPPASSWPKRKAKRQGRA